MSTFYWNEGEVANRKEAGRCLEKQNALVTCVAMKPVTWQVTSKSSTGNICGQADGTLLNTILVSRSHFRTHALNRSNIFSSAKQGFLEHPVISQASNSQIVLKKKETNIFSIFLRNILENSTDAI